jgi:hypothetical protein
VKHRPFVRTLLRTASWRVTVSGMADAASPDSATTLAEEALLGLLLPFWQLVIGVVVLAVFLVSIGRLARRGRSRMTTALLVTAAAIAGLTMLSVLLQG